MATIKIHNVETGEVIEREMNKTELAQLATDQANWVAEQAAAEAQAQNLAEAKASAEAKLAALGLTADEIAAFRG